MFGAGLFSLTQGCKEDEPAPAPACSLASDARGSDACHRWQRELCSYVGRCPTSLEKCECLDQASGIFCASDAEATRCADELAAAECGGFPAGCDLTDLADPAPAQAACYDFIDSACEASVRCGLSDLQTCLDESATQIDCAIAIGAKPRLDRCLSELSTISCSGSAATTTAAGRFAR
jgi:hypothetical protein